MIMADDHRNAKWNRTLTEWVQVEGAAVVKDMFQRVPQTIATCSASFRAAANLLAGRSMGSIGTPVPENCRMITILRYTRTRGQIDNAKGTSYNEL